MARPRRERRSHDPAAPRGLAATRRRAGVLPREAAHAGGEPRRTGQALQDAFEDAVLMGVDEQRDAPHPGRDGRGPGIAEARRPMRLLVLAVLVVCQPRRWHSCADHRHAADCRPRRGSRRIRRSLRRRRTPPAAPQPIQPTWLPQGTAELQVLDKVNAQNALLTVKVGQEAQFGSLNIQVQACSSPPARSAAGFGRLSDDHRQPSPMRRASAAGCWPTTRRCRCCSIRSTTCASSAAAPDACMCPRCRR